MGYTLECGIVNVFHYWGNNLSGFSAALCRTERSFPIQIYTLAVPGYGRRWIFPDLYTAPLYYPVPDFSEGNPRFFLEALSPENEAAR